MNELSKDINIITDEIKKYKETIDKSIFEIGRRLKHVKKNNLVHGQWLTWLKSIGMNPKTATTYIQAHEQFGSIEKLATNLSVSKIIEMVSLPESVDRMEFISQQHAIPSTGIKKTVSEMTVREIREVKATKRESASMKLPSCTINNEKANDVKQQTISPTVASTRSLSTNNNQKKDDVEQLLIENKELKKEIDSLRIKNNELEVIEKEYFILLNMLDNVRKDAFVCDGASKRYGINKDGTVELKKVL
ncbi:DUF3102 domain-containing protein [Paenibacillus polymyxa]|uniref:DUF3102 domain-containing protein n=1 Tax=Paenibacillus polymyxa TaxID=1406 RepID=UPI00287F59D7|nr:DUF3102 domain-containing protein [Paenibacillus polymyxa]